MKERIIQAVFSALDQVNEQLPREHRLEKSMQTALFGRRGNLDSLGLVTMTVAVEQKIEEEFKTAVMLADEQALSRKGNPFETVDSLVDYIAGILKEKIDEQG